MRLNLPSHLGRLAKHFRDADKQFYLVGGALRDQLLGRDHYEWDAATDAQPDETLRLIRLAEFKDIATVGKRFGTIAGKYHDEPVEITTYRTEQYPADSRKPAVKFGRDLDEDLSRRDFTINALAYDPLAEQLIDRHGGKRDLSLKLIRAVGDPAERFDEDPLRMLRAVRLATQLGFTIERQTLLAIIGQKDRSAESEADRSF